MKFLLILYIWLDGIWFLLFNKKKDKQYYAQRIDSPTKEHTWITATNKHLIWVHISIGPHLPWPEIQKIFRFIKQHTLRIILTIEGIDDNWVDINRSYHDWIINLLNKFEVPTEIKAYQILRDPICSKSYMELVDIFLSLDCSNANPINKGKIIPDKLGSTIIIDKINNFFYRSTLSKNVEGIYQKLKQLHKAIKDAVLLTDNLQGKKVYVVCSIQEEIEQALAIHIYSKIFKNDLKAVIF